MMQNRINKFLKLSLAILIIVTAIWFVNRIGINQLRTNVAQFGIWAPLTLILLRLTSIIIPVLPGTAYALLSGALLGFGQGLMVVIIADSLACNTNFFIARRYGRQVVQRIVGKRLMNKLDQWSKKYLEGNFFIMTGTLMTSFFDYICYAIGLSHISWKRFVSALGVSLIIFKPSVVAAGAGLIQGEKLLIGGSLIGMLVIGIISAWFRSKEKQLAQSEQESNIPKYDSSRHP
jgi:uncharacterized membrane protein YdjX (TVP38/TMEM64 family)